MTNLLTGMLRIKVCSILTLVLQVPFASSFDPDRTRQNVGPDLAPKCLILSKLFDIKKDVFVKVDFAKRQQAIKKHAQLSERLNLSESIFI